jgi:hypothetical protein
MCVVADAGQSQEAVVLRPVMHAVRPRIPLQGYHGNGYNNLCITPTRRNKRYPIGSSKEPVCGTCQEQEEFSPALPYCRLTA